jgi:hypothetical protein
MESDSVFKGALVELRRTLKERGFSAKGTTFYRKAADGNTVVLSMQRSVKSTPAETKVTINYGVYSARIGRKLQEDASSARDVSKVHWRKRLAEGGKEKWLDVKFTDSPDDSARVILGALEGILGELAEHSSDEALRSDWLLGRSPGCTSMQRLVFLAILLSEIGPSERLEDVVKKLRSKVAGSVHEGLVERQLATAGVKVP